MAKDDMEQTVMKQLHDEAEGTGNWDKFDGFILGISLPIIQEELESENEEESASKG